MMRQELTVEALGTQVRIVCVSLLNVDDVMNRVVEECRRIESSFSRFVEGNELSRLNGSLGEWVDVSDELYDLLVFGHDLFERTEGAFDMTVGSLLEGWGYDDAYSFKEGESGSLGRIEFEGGRVRVSAPVDLGGLGKGYALDRMNDILNEVDHVLLDAGGDLLVRGLDADGKRWRVALEHPTDLSKAIGVVEVSGSLALASSSPAKRRWGSRHHLVDPKNEAPADNMLAVYTQAQEAMMADAYATALFALGFEAAQHRLSEFPVEAMIVSPQGAMARSAGFQGELFLS